MKPSRLAVLLASLLAIPATVVAACSFPEIGFVPLGASSAGEASTAASGGILTGASAAASGTSTAASGGGASGTSSSSSGPPTCNGDACDCDSDGEQSWECDGGDCADYDERANTKADFLLDDQPIQGPKRKATQDFDFNCNGSVEGQIPALQKCDGLGIGDCNGSGYIDSLGCGKSAKLGHCKAGVLTCETIDESMSKIQGCR